MPHVKTNCLGQTVERIEERERERERERASERASDLRSYRVFERARKVGVQKFLLSERNILITCGFFEAVLLAFNSRRQPLKRLLFRRSPFYN